MTFKLDPEAEKRRISATTLIKVLLANRVPEVLPKHYRELLRILLWKITEAESDKYETRFQSHGAQNFREKGKLRHDHVYQCSRMIDKLVQANSEEEVEGILKTAIGCTVTLDEHIRLNKFDDEYGWPRYRKAGIAVRNIETGEQVV
jgi:hypothetical protein